MIVQHALELPYYAGPSVESGPFMVVYLASLVCFECRSAARQKAEAIGIPMEPDAGLHFYYGLMGMN